tara:strand:+ start:1575 stop:1847 length:273 start_codon:yes stop_codon:yes gene_type:complete
MMNKYKFDWEQVVRGEIEIEAANGQEAEAMFHQMSLCQKVNKSTLANTGDNPKIQFVDFDWTDTVTYDEWKKNWNLTPDEWEEWGKHFNV